MFICGSLQIIPGSGILSSIWEAESVSGALWQTRYNIQCNLFIWYTIYIAFDKLDGCCLSSLDDMMSSHNDPDIKGQAVLHMLACSLGDLRYCTMIYVLTI